MVENRDIIYQYQPLWGKWHIESLIGKGNFGSVYRITREEMGSRYNAAVKIITVPSEEQYYEAQAMFGDDPTTLNGYFEDIVKGIIREINVMYSLSGHSNIIGYLDHEVIKKPDGLGYDILIRMELVTSLPGYLETNQMTGEQVARLGINICSALELCAKKGILHRDIKDENIFISEDGVFKLGDFGISKVLSESCSAASMHGTPLYMSPEMYRGEDYGATVDTYALGIVMYKLLNHGRVPFMPPYPEPIKFKDSELALEKRLAGELLPVPASAGNVLGSVVLKACTATPHDRFASASDMREALTQALSAMSAAERREEVTPKCSAKKRPESAPKVVAATASAGVKADMPERAAIYPAGEKHQGFSQTEKTVMINPIEKTVAMHEKILSFSDGGSETNRKPELKDRSNAAVKTKSRKSWAACIASAVAAIAVTSALFLFGIVPVGGTSANMGSEEIQFQDLKLENAIREKLGINDRAITENDVKGIATLDIRGAGIQDISALAYFTGLTELNLSGNQVIDLSPISMLFSLTTLDLSGNQITNVDAISKLFGLQSLNLNGNQIADVAPLADMRNLNTLYLSKNAIADIGALSELTDLTVLALDGNSIVDITALSEMKGLQELYLSGNQINNYSPIIGYYDQLATKDFEGTKVLGEGFTIGLSINASTEFYSILAATMSAKADEMGVELIIADPQWDSDAQTAHIEEFVESGVDAIVLTPSDYKADMQDVLNKAQAVGIPVFTVVIPIEGDVTTFFDLGGYQGGVLAAQYAAEVLGGSGQVAVIGWEHPVVVERFIGFLETISTYSGINIVDIQVAAEDEGPSQDKGMQLMETILQNNPDIDLVFCATDDMALGATMMVETAGLNTKVIGYDGNDYAIEAIAGSDNFIATISVDMTQMSDLIFQQLSLYFSGEEIGPTVSLSPYIIDREN